MPGLFCGIDLGSTNVKVVLADAEGRALYTRSVPSPRISDGVGDATDASALVALIESMVIDGWREVGRGMALRSIATAGVGEDGIGVRRDMSPTGPALPWFDTRAGAEADALRCHAAATARAGIAVGPDRTAAKWLWLRRHRPDVLAEASQWIALTDYPAAWWTGRPFMSATLAARTACYDVFDRHWIAPMLEAAGAPPLPELLEAGAVIGAVRAGPLRASGAASPETLVVAGGHDHPVAASAIRRMAPAARVDSMGTANLVYGEAPRPSTPYFDPFMAFSVPVSGAAAVACLGVMELSATLASTQVDQDRLREMLAAPRIPGEPGTIGSASPDEAHRVRRSLESAAFHARRMFDAMDQAGAPAGPVYATGGWARSRAFLELRASVFGKTIHVLDEPELTAIGAAYLGAVASAGSSPDLLATRHLAVVEPVPAWSARYEALYPAARERLEEAAAS